MEDVPAGGCLTCEQESVLGWLIGECGGRMNGDLGRITRAGAWVALALGVLSACNAGPESKAGAAASPSSVVEAVRVATDRSGIQQGSMTLPSGERIRRITLRNGFSHVLVARMGPDGKPLLSCVDNAPAAEAFLSASGSGQ